MLQLNTKSTKSNTQGFDEIATKVFNGHIIRTEGNMVCLTDIWKAVGNKSENRPKNYLGLDRTLSVVKSILSKNIKGQEVAL